MSTFIKNLNKYIEHHGIKNNFISKISGIENNKLYSLLNGIQDIKYEEMDIIAKSLGKDIKYFMQENLDLSEPIYEDKNCITFQTGSVDDEKRELAKNAFDFLEHVDAILGVRKKIEKDSLKISDYISKQYWVKIKKN